MEGKRVEIYQAGKKPRGNRKAETRPEPVAKKEKRSNKKN